MARKPFKDFQLDLLAALIEAQDKTSSRVDPWQVADAVKLKYYPGMVLEAVTKLGTDGFVNWTQSARKAANQPDSGITLTLTSKAWDIAVTMDEYKERKTKKKGEKVPAAGRIVTIKHNTQKFKDAEESLEKVISAIDQNNEYKMSDPKDQERKIAELKGGQELLKSKYVDVEKIKAFVIKTLEELKEKLKDTALGDLIDLAIRALLILFGIS